MKVPVERSSYDLPKDWFKRIELPGVNVELPGLYEWRIEGVGFYIGQYSDLRKRLGAYKRNVKNLLTGKDYRKSKPAKFRRIHESLKEAICSKRPITLTFLENSILATDRNRRERELISERRAEAARLGLQLLNGSRYIERILGKSIVPAPQNRLLEETHTVLHPGSLLTVDALPIPEVAHILALTARLDAMPLAERAHILAFHRVALLFYESSTRTRTSFELAAKSLGATTTLVSDKSSSIEKGESLKDTGLTLRALGAECIILRHPSSGAPHLLARATGLPVLNAGDGMHQHPSQALLDLRTILTRLHIDPTTAHETILKGVTIVITGDIRHSRVARSNAMLLPRLGARVILCGPEPLLPHEALSLHPSIKIVRDFDEALAQADVAMMLRIQRERLVNLDLDLPAYIAAYQLTEDRLRALAPNALVLHPGPMIRGLEIEGEVADSPNSAIEEQVTHGLAVRSALLVRALGATA